jgi:hypothetical protein
VARDSKKERKTENIEREKKGAGQMTKKALSQKEKIERACARAGTLKDKILAARRSANEVKKLARGLKSELKETINLLNAIRRQMEDMAVNGTSQNKDSE